MSEDREGTEAILADYAADLEAAKTAHGALIADLVREAGSEEAIDDLLADCEDDAKGALAARCANACGDGAAEQEEAIARAEEWFSDNVSNASLEDRVAATVVAWGEGDAAFRIRTELGVPAIAAAPDARTHGSHVRNPRIVTG